MAALEIMENEPEHVKRLWENGEKMQRGLEDLGYNIGNSQTPIIPVIIGDLDPMILTWRLLLERGVYTNPVIPPAVQPNQTMLRTSYMATHTDEQLDCVLEVFAQTGRQVGLIPEA